MLSVRHHCRSSDSNNAGLTLKPDIFAPRAWPLNRTEAEKTAMPLFVLNASALHRGTVLRTASSSLHKSLYIRLKHVDKSRSLQHSSEQFFLLSSEESPLLMQSPSWFSP